MSVVGTTRELDVALVTDAVRAMCIEANYDLPDDVCEAFARGTVAEQSPAGKAVFAQLTENAAIARRDRVPICQDTGFAVFFVNLGQDVHLVGGSFEEAVNEGVRRGYADGYLRKSIAAEPAHARRNTTDNTPAVLHVSIVAGDRVEIWMMAKGGGAENMSSLAMLKPSQGWPGMVQAVLDTVSRAGANPCPPIILGVGIGGTIDMVTVLAKKALLRDIGSAQPDERLTAMEAELLARVNALGIGPQGLGGTQTCLAVFIEEMPCHIASLPLAVNVQCHAQRHRHVVL